MNTIVLVTPPAVEPVTLFDLKTQIGLSPVEDSDQVKSEQLRTGLRRYIATARAECENRTRRAFITQTWKLQKDSWYRHDPRHVDCKALEIKLPKPPFQSIVAFDYVDPSGSDQVLTEYSSAGDPVPFSYQLDAGSETQPARLWPGPHTSWPPIHWVQSAISITFDCGYGDTGVSVPAPITQAILFLAHSYYDESAFKDIDETVDNLLRPYLNRVS